MLVPILLLLLAPSLLAQRAFERRGHVIYEDSGGHRSDLGVGFSPVLTQSGEVALVRGRLLPYGEHFDCRHKNTRNWIAVYSPVTGTEKVLFDRPLRFERGGLPFCVFERMQLSPDESTLYLVAAVYATSGSLAIVPLQQGTVTFVPGVCDIYVIINGSHRGELLYQRRMYPELHIPGDKGRYPYYPFVHARADGKPIRVVADEFPRDGVFDGPRVARYLRSLGGQIILNGQAFPR